MKEKSFLKDFNAECWMRKIELIEEDARALKLKKQDFCPKATTIKN